MEIEVKVEISLTLKLKVISFISLFIRKAIIIFLMISTLPVHRSCLSRSLYVSKHPLS